MQSTDFVSWPSGDTNIVYPNNRSSLRLEAFRDGVEAFEKYHIVKAELEKAGNSAGLAKLKMALEPFTWAEGQKIMGSILKPSVPSWQLLKNSRNSDFTYFLHVLDVSMTIAVRVSATMLAILTLDKAGKRFAKLYSKKRVTTFV